MKYVNPVVRGFYPDPSVCEANGTYYLVTSSFQYFPGVPLFESKDLVNWKQIGHVLSRKDQVMLDRVRSSGGVFAPTIRHHNGRFYMVTNNNSTNKNFYVRTDDIYGAWSDPVEVDQDGIDPSLLFDGDHVYFVSNGVGTDASGRQVNGVFQCEIDPDTGKRLTEKKLLWTGSGGRYIESPHVYRIGDYYYLVVAEGGTEYGHMITYARAENVWGPYEAYAKNPVLTNRNKAPFLIQGIGHGDLIQGRDGSWYMLSLGFRQIGEWEPYHHLGREVFLTPAVFDDRGWFTCGRDGTTDFCYELPGDFAQEIKTNYTFANTKPGMDWVFLRNYHPENYDLSEERFCLTGSSLTLEDVDSPTFVALRQREFAMELSCDISISETVPEGLLFPAADFCANYEAQVKDGSGYTGEAGLTVYMDENCHYDLSIALDNHGFIALLRINIGEAKYIKRACRLPEQTAGAKLRISSDACTYRFSVLFADGRELPLGEAGSKYLSSEVASGFTGVMLGLYAIGPICAEARGFDLSYL